MIKELWKEKKPSLYGSCFLGVLFALAFIPVDQPSAASAGDLSGLRFSIGVKAPQRTNLPPVSTIPADRPKSPSPSPIQPRFIPVELAPSFRPQSVPLTKSPGGATIPVMSKSEGMQTDMMSAPGPTQYWYDPLNRLTRVAYPNRTIISYTYDKTGNRMSRNMFLVDISCDFNNDRKADIGIYRVNEGVWYITPSGGGTPYGVAWGGDSSDKPVPGDYDGDGKADEAFYRASTGEWHILSSGGGTPYTVGWGTTGDKPVPGDYDGDGKTDLAIYRPSDGGWYITPSGGGEPYGVGWGGDASDKLVPGDYDGDGATDIAIYRASSGGWYIIPSGSGIPYGVPWGTSGDSPVPGDYDGDGATDVAVYRPSDGGWYIVPSGGGEPYGVGWGGDASDKLVPGDYDGDGATDVAIYRASNGGWYILPSGGGDPYGLGWGGGPSDIPLSSNLPSY